ncbi:hypothetical protein CO005_03495 [Candidatus Roizmanbacteria bacterium CG_4_8_14_3_um_filter_34_9]|uniref:Big-1 domain-containing protein n=3 Tax=Candidatus Roizmaniibacteriota TaxID=1752723 RepID=A0A2M7ATT6_9BACT|nr:MAG: hypothetical protein COT02_06340 [Candidatus Roizmanbacteria bacterium CG07_land_8_20_14_0_80_34_15]PIU74008.1 MAG: hypothetical protein COS77_03745 [Candidatus Roizmanbacteria bacterium CG06_land_8_20_14_3_00_34_14]PIW73057.1 MAG: hypothetical protein CO005_03495 [Candidatus Roizmanbacteria bacterium CG_4_8_14_3_um_filter_34_9]
MDKKFIALMVLFFIVFGIFITNTLFSKQLTGFARASATTDPSPKTSLIFAWPLTAKVGDKIDINVFVRNASNSPVDNKPVKLVTNLGVINGAQESTTNTDKTGKVNFVLTSDTVGTAELTAYVNGNTPLDQKVTIKFE